MSKQCCTKLKCFSNPELRRHLVSDRTAFRAKSSLLERYDIQLIYYITFCCKHVLSVHIASLHTLGTLWRHCSGKRKIIRLSMTILCMERKCVLRMLHSISVCLLPFCLRLSTVLLSLRQILPGKN
jgi:hypothetical protein